MDTAAVNHRDSRFREATLLQNRALAKLERFRQRGLRNEIGAAFQGRSALEVGGPSSIFAKGGLLPIYPALARLDGCNFAQTTIWNDQHPELPQGTSLVGEASALPVADGAYGGFLASHVLEHVADALSTLAEWRRVLAADGAAVIVVPHKDYTFDHRRPVTTLEHFEADLDRRTQEDDLTHLPEVLALHDSRHDHFEGDADQFRRRGEDNARVRALHHHVFTTESFFHLLQRAGFSVQALVAARPYHVAAFCQDGADAITSGGPGSPLAQALRSSPFPSDRR